MGWLRFEHFFNSSDMRPILTFKDISYDLFSSYRTKTGCERRIFFYSSCNRVSWRLIKYFFSYLDHEIPIYEAKIQIFSRGMSEIISTTYGPRKRRKTAPIVLRNVVKFQGNQKKNSKQILPQKPEGRAKLTILGKICLKTQWLFLKLLENLWI